MNKFIPLSVPNLCGNELMYVSSAINEGWVSTGGAYITRFEKEIASYLKVDEAVACQSGTAGLHLSLILSDVGYDDEVIVPALTFIAAVNPVKYLGANPIFMDCDDSLCMDMDKLECFCQNECELVGEKLINKKTSKHIKAIIVVHIFGNLANMEKAIMISEKYNLKLIEDATEALGSYYISGEFKGKFAGTIGDFGVCSFNGNKIITTGGGGMMVIKDSAISKKAKYLSTQAKDDEINFIHNEIGYNYRMTNLQAALGVAQLENLEKFITTKSKNYNLYKEKIDKMEKFKLLDFESDIRPNYWFYSLFIKDIKKTDKDKLISFLGKNNIQSRPIWGLINEQRPYLDCQTYNIEKANYYFDRIVNIPCGSDLTEEEVNYIISKISEFC